MRKGTYSEPQQVTSNPLTSDRYPMKPNEQFLFVHWPGNWQHVTHRGETKWLPMVGTVPMMRGANGITGDADGNRDPSAFIAKLERQGGTAIRHTDRRLGEFVDYMYKVECVHRGHVGHFHMTQFQTLHVMNGQTRVRTDDEGYRDFLQHLVDVGIVEPMSDVVLEMEIDKQDRRLNNIMQRVGQNPHLGTKLDASTAKKALMQTDWDRQFGAEAEEPEPPAPKVKAKPKTTRTRKPRKPKAPVVEAAKTEVTDG